MRNGGQLLVESLIALGRISKAAPTPDAMAEALTLLNISPEALTPRQTLSQMRAAALAAKENA